MSSVSRPSPLTGVLPSASGELVPVWTYKVCGRLKPGCAASAAVSWLLACSSASLPKASDRFKATLPAPV